MRPFRDVLHIAMLDRIVVNVIRMTLEVPLVANEVFPEPALPDFPFAFAMASMR